MLSDRYFKILCYIRELVMQDVYSDKYFYFYIGISYGVLRVRMGLFFSGMFKAFYF